jgi:Tfp pilus assembly PilM family ATPase
VGSSFTNLAIINDNEIPFVRDIAYAGDEIIRQIAAEHNLSAETVSEILSGREDGKLSRPKLDESLERACKKLIVDVSETLRYYTAQEKTTIKEVFVCGGFALTEGFIDLLERELPVRAVLWNPFEKMKQKSPLSCREVVEKNGPAMAVAAGLAMRSI